MGAGGDGGRSVGRPDGAGGFAILFYGELRCFRRFVKVFVESAPIFAREEVTNRAGAAERVPGGRSRSRTSQFPESEVGGTGGGGRRSRGRRNDASRRRMVFHGDLHCF